MATSLPSPLPMADCAYPQSARQKVPLRQGAVQNCGFIRVLNKAPSSLSWPSSSSWRHGSLRILDFYCKEEIQDHLRSYSFVHLTLSYIKFATKYVSTITRVCTKKTEFSNFFLLLRKNNLLHCRVAKLQMCISLIYSLNLDILQQFRRY